MYGQNYRSKPKGRTCVMCFALEIWGFDRGFVLEGFDLYSDEHIRNGKVLTGGFRPGAGFGRGVVLHSYTTQTFKTL